MKMLRQKHSKLGIVSCIIAVGVWVYLAILFFLFIYTDRISKFIEDNFLREADGHSSLGAAGLALIIIIFMFVMVPIAGHFTGFILGIAGSLQTSKKRLFGVIGLAANFLPLAVGITYYFIDTTIYKH